MKEVGDRFGCGELILPFVLQSAEAMKRAVTHLERYLEKSEGVAKGRVVLATVYGDVHDIGKNLIKTILANNGYEVHDLGKQVPVHDVVDRAVELRADVIGLSALLVSTSRQMPLVVRELDRRGLAVPVLVGGAAINREFGRDITFIDERPYAGGVLYCRDAFEGLDTVDRLADPAARKDLLEGERRAAVVRRIPMAADEETLVRSAVEARAADVPAPPFWGARSVASLPLDEVFQRLNEARLFKTTWGGGGSQGRGDAALMGKVRAQAKPEWKGLRAEFAERLARMKREAADEGWLAPAAVYGYFPAQSEGNQVLVFDPDDRSKVLGTVLVPAPARRGPPVPGRLLPAGGVRDDGRAGPAGGHGRTRRHIALRRDGRRERVLRGVLPPRPGRADRRGRHRTPVPAHARRTRPAARSRGPLRLGLRRAARGR